MPWQSPLSVSFPAPGDGRYQRLNLSVSVPVLQWGVQLASSPAAPFRRRRVGFLYPCIEIEGRTLLGPCQELTAGWSNTSIAFQALSFGWVTEVSDLRPLISVYGVLVAPDRGFYPSVATLWRLIA